MIETKSKTTKIFTFWFASLSVVLSVSAAADSLVGTYRGFLAFDHDGKEIREGMVMSFFADGNLIMGAEDHPPDAAPDAPPVGIGEGSLIQDAIVDLNARIGRNVRIVNEQRLQDASGDGWVIREGIVVVTKNAVIPDGTVI